MTGVNTRSMFTRGWIAAKTGRPKKMPKGFTQEQQEWWIEGFDAFMEVPAEKKIYEVYESLSRPPHIKPA